MIYRVDSAASRVVTRARSSIHDTVTTWGEVSGEIDTDPEVIRAGGGAATGRLAVDMSRFDAGDFLRNRKLRKDLDVQRHPVARFALSRLEGVAPRPDGSFAATARGTLHWRDRSIELAAAGVGHIDDRRIEASASFDLDVRDLGITPPRLFVFKVQDVVLVEITLLATSGGTE